MTTLTDIPALLEPLTGPDRRVDVLIGVALCWRQRTMSKDMRAMHNLMGMSIAHMTEEAERRTTALHHLPRWTGSVDAGISLIPDGWRLASTSHRSRTDAVMAHVLNERIAVTRYAPTLALAVTQAAVGALIDTMRQGREA